MAPRPRTRSGLEELAEYVAGLTLEQSAERLGMPPERLVKLNSNENCLGPSPRAVEAARRAAEEIALYPTPDAAELRRGLARQRGVPVESVVVGAGMDGVLETVYRAFLDPGDEVLIPTPTFSYYELAARLFGAKPRFVSRTPAFEVRAEDVLDARGPRTKAILLTSPNNPTGNLVAEKIVREVAEGADALVFVDQAYGEFSEQNLDRLPEELENVVVGHTLSKAYGLAGLRVGYAIAPPWAARECLRVATPFAVSRVAIAAALAAIGDEDHLRASVDAVRRGREYLRRHVRFATYPSQANFVAVDTSPLASGEVCTALLRRGVLVRDCASFRGAGERLLRVTVGTEPDNRRLVEELNALHPGP